MLQVVRAVRQIALLANVAVRLVHHTRKTGGEAVTGESLRGASSLFGGARRVDVINSMTEKEATTLRVHRDDRTNYFRISNAKANYSAREGDRWFETKAVTLPNGDVVATVRDWTPSPIQLDYESVVKIYDWLAKNGPARGHHTAEDWFGWRILEILEGDRTEQTNDHKEFANALIDILKKSGVIKSSKTVASRQQRPAFEAGELPIEETWLSRTS